MLRVSSWVVTTGADSLAATCSSLGCSAPSNPRPLAVLQPVPLEPLAPTPMFEFPVVGLGAVTGVGAAREERERVSLNTSCLSWSTSITSALESGVNERREMGETG